MLKAPFPYFGGKRRWANAVWKRFGRVDRYSEPFGGSIAMLLANPSPAHIEIVCDTNCFIPNFWRAVAAAPKEVAYWADWPTYHADLYARHTWLRARRAELAERITGDMDWFDAKTAGIWVWGQSHWIGIDWGVATKDSAPLVKTDCGGGGVSAQKASLQNGAPGPIDPTERGKRLEPWMTALAERLSNAIVMRRNWSAGVTPARLGDTMDGAKNVGVFLDPPYRVDGDGRAYAYGVEEASDDAAIASYEWAVENGNRYKVAYCCRLGDFELPIGWSAVTRSLIGFGCKRGRDDQVMFSPKCRPSDRPSASLFD